MKVLKNLKLGKKLLILMLIFILSLTVFGGTSYQLMKQMNNNSILMYKKSLLHVEWLNQSLSNQHAINSYLLELMLATDDSINNSLQQKIDQVTQEENTLINEYEQSGISPYEQSILSQYKSMSNEYQKARQEVITLASKNAKQEAYFNYTQNISILTNKMDSSLNALTKYNSDKASELSQSNQQSFTQAIIIMVIILSVSLLASLIIGFLIVRSITIPIHKIQTLMKEAESGNLSVQGDYVSDDEIGILTKSFNSMISGIQAIIKQISESSLSLASTSEELTAGAEQTGKAAGHISVAIQEASIGSEKQSSSVMETVQVVEEMSAGVKQIALNSQEITQTAKRTSDVVMEGNQSIQKAIEQMNSIHSTVEASASIIKELGDQAKLIGNIIETITDISAQTNLLALNAAIEAARAGEHGRGFSVVADEVRKLAEESSESAKKISGFIKAIHENISKVVTSMEQGTLEVNMGIEVVHVASESFEKIEKAIYDVNVQIHHVSASAQQIADGTGQVEKSIHLILEAAEQAACGTQTVSSATEEQLASMQEIEASANSLSRMSEELQALVSKFQI